MIIAHLPAGYLLTKALARPVRPENPRWFYLAGLAGALAPDLDILWFYIEGGVRNHRYYPTHWPLTWLVLFLAAALVLAALKKPRLMIYPAAVLANALFHLALDCLSAPIFWAAPFGWEAVELVEVPARYGWWVMNFLSHWTFKLELAIWALAAAVFGWSFYAVRRERRNF